MPTEGPLGFGAGVPGLVAGPLGLVDGPLGLVDGPLGLVDGPLGLVDGLLGFVAGLLGFDVVPPGFTSGRTGRVDDPEDGLTEGEVERFGEGEAVGFLWLAVAAGFLSVFSLDCASDFV